MKRLVVILVVALAASAIALGLGKSGKRGGAPQQTARADRSLEQVREAGVLRWGTDVVGGVPYVYEDPANPGTYIGFEKDIAEAIGRELGVRIELVIKAWDTLVPELQRGSFDMAMNGIEDTAERDRIVLFSDPYFVYSQQITVRRDAADAGSLGDLVGKRVATLSGTAAEDILRATPGIEVVTNPEIIYSYRDLEEGRVEAVLLDTPIAAAYGAANPKLKNTGKSFNEGRYVIAFRTEERALRDAVNQALAKLKADGTLGSIYRKWGLMDTHQAKIGVI